MLMRQIGCDARLIIWNKYYGRSLGVSSFLFVYVQLNTTGRGLWAGRLRATGGLDLTTLRDCPRRTADPPTAPGRSCSVVVCGC
jgi:hypothetical protein